MRCSAEFVSWLLHQANFPSGFIKQAYHFMCMCETVSLRHLHPTDAAHTVVLTQACCRKTQRSRSRLRGLPGTPTSCWTMSTHCQSSRLHTHCLPSSLSLIAVTTLLTSRSCKPTSSTANTHSIKQRYTHLCFQKTLYLVCAVFGPML